MAKKTPKTVDNSEVIAKLEEEFKYVNGNVKRLTAAIALGDKFVKKVGEEQAGLLCDQLDAMKTYRNILAIRISLLKDA